MSKGVYNKENYKMSLKCLKIKHKVAPKKKEGTQVKGRTSVFRS